MEPGGEKNCRGERDAVKGSSACYSREAILKSGGSERKRLTVIQRPFVIA
jgi:hypothetical protein